MPKMKASEVIMIGRKRSWAALIAASATLAPFVRWSRANSTTRMAFLAAMAIISTMPIWQYMSLANWRAIIPPTTPSRASGTARITAIGLVQLS
jgi:hypothetical protein